MSSEAWGFLGAAVTALSALIAALGVAWIQFARRTSRVEEATKELKPNGGGSMHDTVRRIESKVDAQGDLFSTQLAEVRGAFMQHCTEAAEARREWNEWRDGLRRSA